MGLSMTLRAAGWRFAAVGAVVALALVSGCRGDSPKPSRPHIVFILIDALRADHVALYGYERDTTPHIDALGRAGLVFEEAATQAPWTASSMASIWTSRYPSETGLTIPAKEGEPRKLTREGVTRMGEEVPTLAEVLGHHGYHRISVTANPYASDRFGLLRGFEDVVHKHTGAVGAVRRAKKLAEASLQSHPKKPFFLYVHFVDLHAPVRPPAPYDTRYPTLDGKPHTERHQKWGGGRGVQGAIHRSHYVALYDGALRFVDAQIGELREWLSDRGALEHTIFIVASDHGEEFWDNIPFQEMHHLDPRRARGVGHGHSMFRELLHVPLVISGPGVPAVRVTAQVRNLDIAPTILSLAGVPAEPSFRGEDLVEPAREGNLQPRLAFSEEMAYGHNAFALQDGRFKLVEYEKTLSGITEFLFDERTASPEKREVAAQHPEALRRLRGRLAEIRGSRALRDGTLHELDESVVDELRSLGYAE